MTTFYFNSSGNLGSYALPEHWQFANIIATTAITLNTKLEHSVKNAFFIFTSPPPFLLQVRNLILLYKQTMLTFTNDNIFVFILRQYIVHESPLSVPELLNSRYA